MKNRTLTIVTMMSLAFLAGCASDVAQWTPAESPKKNAVQRTTSEHFVKYPAHAKSFCKMEKKALKDYLSVELQYPNASHVYLTEHGGHNQDRVDEVIKLVRMQGLGEKEITVDDPISSAHYSGSGVSVLVERFVVIPPSCSDWSFELGGADGHRPMSNTRCADVSNLGMMVADPRDLLYGKDVDFYDGTRHALSVQMYRGDKVKKLINENTSSVGSASSGA